MKISKVTISNFRNITNAEYELGRLNMIRGRNHIGKTNVIQAVYWCLTDSLIDDSNEIDSILPHHNTKLVTSVELTFDTGATFRKEYKEKWVRNKGSLEETLDGHETIYWINGVKSKKGEAVTQVIDWIIPGCTLNPGKDVNLVKLMLNPLYLFGQVDYKIARKFLINIVGDISDSDVFNANPDCLGIRSDLMKVGNKPEVLKKNYDDHVKVIRRDIAADDIKIDIARKSIEENTISDDQYQKAEDYMKVYDRTCHDIQNEREETEEERSVKAQIATLSNEILELQELVAKEKEEATKAFSEVAAKREREYNEAITQSFNLQRQANSLERDINSIKATIDNDARRVSSLMNEKQELLNKYHRFNEREFVPNESKCPHCGYILNGDDVEKARADFENLKKSELAKITERGKAIASDIKTRESLIKSNEAEIPALKAKYEKLLEDIKEANRKCDDIKNSPREDMPVIHQSENEKNLLEKKAKLTEMKAYLTKVSSSSKELAHYRLLEYIEQESDNLKKAQAIRNYRIILNHAQQNLDDAEAEKMMHNRQMVEYDEKLAMLHDFTKTKLELINASTRKVFPDIEFVLIEDNITSGSFSEVCYPLIKGKKTHFEHGSGSEKVLTGIAIIEDIRRYINAPESIIIFDEGEQLDSVSLSTIGTDSQIITAVVDDNYTEPTLRVAAA